MSHFVCDHLPNIIPGHAFRSGVTKLWIRERGLQPGSETFRKSHDVRFTRSSVREESPMLRHRAFSKLLRRRCRRIRCDRTHIPQQGAGAGASRKRKRARHKRLPSLGCPRARIHDYVRVREPRVIPGHPLHQTETRIGSRHALRRFGSLHHFPTKRTVPIQNSIFHSPLVFRRRVGAVINDNRFTNIKKRYVTRGPARFIFNLWVRLKKAHVTGNGRPLLLRLKITSEIFRDEITNLKTILLIWVVLTVAHLRTLTHHKLLSLGTHLKDSPLRNLQRSRLRDETAPRNRVGGLGGCIPNVVEDAAHACVEINHNARIILGDNWKCGQQAPGRKVFRNDQPFARLVHIDSIMEDFESNDSTGERGARRSHHLRNHRGGDQKFAP